MFLWWSPLKICSKHLFLLRTLDAMAPERKSLTIFFYKPKELELGYMAGNIF
jgi:hypothetical protein